MDKEFLYVNCFSMQKCHYLLKFKPLKTFFYCRVNGNGPFSSLFNEPEKMYCVVPLLR